MDNYSDKNCMDRVAGFGPRRHIPRGNTLNQDIEHPGFLPVRKAAGDEWHNFCFLIHEYMICRKQLLKRRKIMYEWAFIFLLQAIIAAIFCFTGIAGAYASAAQLIFYILLSLAIFSFIAGLIPKKKTYAKRLIIDIK